MKNLKLEYILITFIMDNELIIRKLEKDLESEIDEWHIENMENEISIRNSMINDAKFILKSMEENK